MRNPTMTEARHPYMRLLKQTDHVIDHPESVPANDNGGWSVAKLPYEPPRFETFHPTGTRLPPGVFEEWTGECFVRTR